MRLHGSVLLLGLAACADRVGEGAPDGGARGAGAVAAFDPADGAVLPDSAAPGLLRQCSRPTPKDARGYWTPRPEEIAALERALAPVLQAALDSLDRPGGTLRAADYHRQYAGVVRPDGRRIIYASGLHRFIVEDTVGLGSGDRGSAESLRARREASWRGEPWVICDGGRSAFGAEYDVETGEVRELHFNGVA